jgi:ferredoxin-NADP reductase
MARAAVLGRLEWAPAQLVSAIAETPSVRSLVLEVPGWRGHRPGQHVDVRLTAEDGYQAQRSYSIASPPEQAPVTLTVERLADGEVSTYLVEELRVGEYLELRGPIGGYFVWNAAMGGSLLLVAGGSGIVPLMAMLRHRSRAGSDLPARLLYSARSYEELIYRDELAELASRDARFEMVQTLTRSQPPGWSGHRRRVDTEMLEELIRPPEVWPHPARTYVCGPTGYVETVANLLVELGHDPATLKTERFGPTGK